MVMNVDYYNKQQRANSQGGTRTVKLGPTRNCSKTFHVCLMTKKIEEKNKSLLCSVVKRKNIKAAILQKKNQRSLSFFCYTVLLICTSSIF